MSNPTPAPQPAPDFDWKYWSSMLVKLLIGIIAAMAVVPEVDPKPAPAPAVTVDPKPVPAAAPESWIVLDSTGTRVTDPTIEKVAGSLKAGRWTAQGIPAPGQKGVTLSITVDDGVVPIPPKPDPKPDPVPEPEPAPIPAAGFRVLILEESTARTPSLQSLLRTPEVETYLNTKTIKVDGFPEWRLLDDDYTTEQQARWSDTWKQAYALAKTDAATGKMPWCVISDGTKGESLSLVKADGSLISKADFLALLRKYGG